MQNNKTWDYKSPPSEKVWQIMLDIANGIPRGKIAKKYGISEPYVSKIAVEQGLHKRKSLTTTVYPIGKNFGFWVKGFEVLIDSEDCNLCKEQTWHVLKNGYVASSRGLLSRQLLSAKKCEIVDHKNGNILDNRRSNLRIVTRVQNAANSNRRKNTNTVFKGVKLINGKYHMQFTHEGRMYSEGPFINPINAALAYDNSSRRILGEYGRVNFPEGGEVSALLELDEKNLAALVNHNLFF